MSYYDLKKAANGDDKTTLEDKHVPVIDAPDKVKKGEYFEVKIKMGEGIDHPMEEKHFIQYVELYADYYQLARVNFTPEMKAEVALTIKLEESCTLRAYEFCNIHGQWEAAKEITVD
ncbi:superoxide reductase [Orenia metallireducens]|jgi:superoxide reductase|uniref:Superoxide reductase n=1 Tax=Orenia metallireducens TaxID=1413210 RepID=A0A285HR55_9FIRM|nr:class II SORL domain-containing protein [Orenia metallireducens]PRX25105.1 superoxide reductase [Orenia metallireducens]SNY38202.1 superoxide reductase [Orenia metallireducens]